MRDEPPCDHYDRLVGTVCAGDIKDKNSPFYGVATCGRCVQKSADFCARQAGRPANPFVSYEESRGQTALMEDPRA